MPLSIGPTDLHADGRLNLAGVAAEVGNQDGLRLLDDGAGEHGVGVGFVDDLVRRRGLDFLHHGFRQPLAQVAAEAVRLEHRHVNRVDFLRKERLVADLIAGAAAEEEQREEERNRK